MNDKEMIELTQCYELDLHQQFMITNFKSSLNKHKNIEELKELLIESMKQLMGKENMIKYLMKKVI